MLYLLIAATINVSANVVISLTAKMEVNMKTISKVICVVGGAALLGRSDGDITSHLQKICMTKRIFADNVWE